MRWYHVADGHPQTQFVSIHFFVRNKNPKIIFRFIKYSNTCVFDFLFLGNFMRN